MYHSIWCKTDGMYQYMDFHILDGTLLGAMYWYADLHILDGTLLGDCTKQYASCIA